MKSRPMRALAAAALCSAIAACAAKKADAENAPAAGTPKVEAIAPVSMATPPAAGQAMVIKPPTVSAKEWGSEPDPMESLRHTPNHVTLHHAGEEWKAGSDPYVKLKNLQSWGKSEKGWPDVPYHFLIAPDGRIFEGRALEFAPDTNTNYDVKGHVGINVWGNFEVQRIRQEQLESVVNLTAWLCNEYGLDVSQVSSHRDVAPGQTVCPGKDYYRYIESGMVRDWISKAMHGQEWTVELLPPSEDGPTEFIPY